MVFVRSWMSDALRAGIAGLAVPVALLAVLAVLALGGAFGGLTSLGQLVAGPQVPLAPAGSVAKANPTAGTGEPAAALPAIPRLRPTGSPSTRGHAVHRFAVGAPQAPGGNPPHRPARHPQPTPVSHGANPTPSGPPPVTGSGSPTTGGGGSGGGGGGGGGGGPASPPPSVQQLVTKVQQSVPQSPADAINTIQQLSSSIVNPGQKLAPR